MSLLRGTRVTWLGHATVLVQLPSGINLLIDPFIEHNPKYPKDFFKEHDSVWYPAFEQLPALKPLIFSLMAHVEGERLGGVLITRIPPGSSVAPHKDVGWHAGYYRKFGVQLRGGPDQFFCFEGETMVADAGDVYEFDNTATHWVENRSDRERITMIVCIKAG